MRQSGKDDIAFFHNRFLRGADEVAHFAVCRVNVRQSLSLKAYRADGRKLRCGMPRNQAADLRARITGGAHDADLNLFHFDTPNKGKIEFIARLRSCALLLPPRGRSPGTARP